MTEREKAAFLDGVGFGMQIMAGDEPLEWDSLASTVLVTLRRALGLPGRVLEAEEEPLG